jgi:hypothetical protein
MTIIILHSFTCCEYSFIGIKQLPSADADILFLVGDTLYLDSIRNSLSKIIIIFFFYYGVCYQQLNKIIEKSYQKIWSCQKKVVSL